jgi:phosphoenolpyruvate synthase/pyruvate phosphate dikinase
MIEKGSKNSNDHRALKIKALNEALEILKERSVMKNMLTYKNIVDLANELYSDKFESKISQTSIKDPKTDDFKQIYNERKNFIIEFKKSKKNISSKVKNEVSFLNETIENLIHDAVKYYDDKQELIMLLEKKEKTIQKLELEINKLIKDIYKLKKRNEN